MRFIHLLSFVVIMAGLSYTAQAQYITPGNSLSLSLDDLVSSSDGVVTGADGIYQVNGALTISATDTVRINQEALIRVASGIRLEFEGTLISDPIEGKVHFTAIDTTNSAANFKGFRFSDSPANLMRNTIVSYGGGLQLISSEAIFEYCTFRHNGSSNVSAVITYSSCSPVIRYCYFIENARSAIGSGANVSGSPHIMYNILIQNTTDNSNRPQINLGPGASDSLYIVGNYIEGHYDMAGGIGLSNLLATGSTKAVVRNNYIVGNRYGYAQIGNNIAAFIADNHLIDNNIQNQPNLGGSGLNFQASGTGNTAIVRRNLITGNLWGVTLQGTANADFGTESDQGGNVFYDNGNSGNIYALYNNTPIDVTAIGNYWGTNDPDEAEDFIFHQPDQADLGLVTYQPILSLEPVINLFLFAVADNPQLGTDIYGEINQDELTIEVVVPGGTDLSNLIPQIGLDFGVISEPQGGVSTDFTDPVEYIIHTPHGEQATYTVTVSIETMTYDLSFEIMDINGTTVSDASITLNGTTYPSGTYVFENLLPGLYSFAIAHPAYNIYESEVEIIDQSVQLTIELIPLSYTVTFEVKDENGMMIPDAVITFDGITYDAGVYSFENIVPGTYPYSVEKVSYESVHGTAEVVDQHLTILIEMQLINSIEETYNQIKLYPNPVNQEAVIKIPNASNTLLKIVDLQGRELLRTSFSGSQYILSVSELVSGPYMLILTSDSKEYVKILYKE